MAIELSLEENLHKIREFFLLYRFSLCPKVIQRPDSLISVEKFISERGKRDLPKIQFDGLKIPEFFPEGITKEMRESLVEMNGILGLGEKGILDWRYSHPKESIISWG